MGGGGFESECESLPKAQVSRNIGVILREMRAPLYERERGIACARQRERSVRNVRTDGKFPESFVLRLVR